MNPLLHDIGAGIASAFTPQKSFGQSVVETEVFRAEATKRPSQRNFGISVPQAILGARNKAQCVNRAGFTSSSMVAVNVDPQQGMVALGAQRLTIMDLISSGETIAAAIPYPKENGYGSIDGVPLTEPRAKAVGEGQLKPSWEADLTTETANVKKIAVTTKIPDEFLSDFPATESYLNTRLPYMVDLEAERQVLYGDGQEINIRGICSTAGIQTRPYATSWADTLKKAITDISVGAQFEPDGIAMHPYDFETASLETDANGQYRMGGPFYIPYGNGVYVQHFTLWGLPVAVTTSVAVGKPVVGAWKMGAQFFTREGTHLQFTNSNEDDFLRNLTAIRCEQRGALAVYRPVSFLEVTGGPART